MVFSFRFSVLHSDSWLYAVPKAVSLTFIKDYNSFHEKEKNQFTFNLPVSSLIDFGISFTLTCHF